MTISIGSIRRRALSGRPRNMCTRMRHDLLSPSCDRWPKEKPGKVNLPRFSKLHNSEAYGPVPVVLVEVVLVEVVVPDDVQLPESAPVGVKQVTGAAWPLPLSVRTSTK